MINKDSLTHHISQQFNAELEEVRSHFLAMGGLVEKEVNDAVTSLSDADSGLAQQVREVDDQINQMERNIDEECGRILARRQPAASDLRLIISISKAACAASPPLLSFVVRARPLACSKSSVVNSPNTTGNSRSRATF